MTDAPRTRPTKRRQRALAIGVPLLVVAGVLGWGSIPEGPLVITPPPADADPGRWVHLEGAANTRDAGGYPTGDGRVVKRGMVYRSAKLNRLSSAGADAYRALGVTTVIDFCNRLTPWPLFGGDVWSVHLASTVHGCPMSFGKDGPREAFYMRGVRDNADGYRAAFELLADAERYPVLYHCAAGTDRTGVMSALVLSLLGVDRATIIADFRLSEEVDLPGSLPAMNALLDHIAAQGGIEAYLAAIGVTPDVQQRVRANLLQTPTPAAD
jgi:protein-tyrosine phosphatase